jgi:hypothetical protein
MHETEPSGKFIWGDYERPPGSEYAGDRKMQCNMWASEVSNIQLLYRPEVGVYAAIDERVRPLVEERLGIVPRKISVKDVNVGDLLSGNYKPVEGSDPHGWKNYLVVVNIGRDKKGRFFQSTFASSQDTQRKGHGKGKGGKLQEMGPMA